MADLGDEDGAPSFPAIVRVAGFIWIGFGGLGLLATLAVVGLAVAQGPGGAPAALCVGACGGLFAAAFLYVGNQTVRGTAKDTLGNGVGSIGISVFYFGMAAISAVAPGGGAGGNPLTGPIVTAIMNGGFGFLLLLAGVLALAGRSRYKVWRETAYPSERRRRGRRYDDDRPRRRRPRDDEEADEEASEDFEERRRRREQRERRDDDDDR